MRDSTAVFAIAVPIGTLVILAIAGCMRDEEMMPIQD